jgi:hypothetical protein
MKRNLVSACVVVLAIIMMTGCSKSKDEKGNFGNHPRTEVPEDLVGYWIAGSTSVGNFWGYDGSYQGAGFELAVGYMLYKDGKAKQYFYYTSTNTGCRTQVLGYKEGSVEINVNAKSFKFYPASGNYRGYQSCGGSQNGQTKQYGANELYPAVSVGYENIEFRKEAGNIKSWHIHFDDGSSLDFTKSQEPQR